MEMETDSEKLKLLALQRGDQQVFESVFKEYYEPLCIHARRYLIDPDAAEEVVQDMFFKMWEKRDSIIISTSLKAYLYKAVTNHSLNYIKYQRISMQYREYIGFTTNMSTDKTGHETLVHSDLQRHFYKLVTSMPERRRMIFEMSRIEGLKYSDIAKRLNISIKTVESQMSKALEYLRIMLRDYLPLWWWIVVITQFF